MMEVQNYAYPMLAGLMPKWHYLDMDNLARIREAKGLTQAQLADMISANQGTISKIEKGIGNPTLTMINKIAKALEVHPADLFTKSGLEQRVMDAVHNMKDPHRIEAAIIVLESMAGKA